jgi:hypothetical protein
MARDQQAALLSGVGTHAAAHPTAAPGLTQPLRDQAGGTGNQIADELFDRLVGPGQGWPGRGARGGWCWSHG